MAVHPCSAAKGFISEKLGIPYEETKSGLDNEDLKSDNPDILYVVADEKKYTLKSNFVPPPPCHPNVCGGGEWEFEIIKDESIKNS